MATPKAHSLYPPRAGTHADAASRESSATRLPVRNGPTLIPSSTQRSVPVPSSGSRLASNPASRPREAVKVPTALGGARKASTPGVPQGIEKRKESRVGGIRKSISAEQSDKSTVRLDAGNLRLAPVLADLNRTPSLVSGSTSSTSGSPQIPSGIRKPSGLASLSTSQPSHLQSKQGTRDPSRTMPARVIQSSPVNGTQLVFNHQDNKEDDSQIIQLDQYVPIGGIYGPDRTVNPTPPYTLMTTPSTNCSPGPFSISSTPTSMSSYNSSQAYSGQSKFSSRLRGPSPNLVQPGASQPKLPPSTAPYSTKGSSAVRGSSTSSGSTIRRKDTVKSDVHSPTSSRSNSISSQQPLPSQPMTQGARRHGSQGNCLRAGSGANLRIFPEFSHLRDAAPLAQGHRETPSVDSSATTTSDQSSSSKMLLKTPFPNLSAIASPDRLMPSKSSVNPSPSRSLVSLTSPQSSRPPTRGTTPDASADQDSSSRGKAASSQTSKVPSRFGFFSKKTRVDESPNKLTKTKLVRKGPSAGTGHEGYGKFGSRGRSGSTTSGSAGSVGAERSPSVDSNSTPGTRESPARKSSIGSKNSADADEFVTERLTPVTLRGNGPNRPALGAIQNASSDIAAHTMSRGLGASTISSGALGSLQHGQVKRPALLPSPIPNGGLPASASQAHLLSPDVDSTGDTTALPQIPAKIGRRMSLIRRKTVTGRTAPDAAQQATSGAANVDKRPATAKDASKTGLSSLKAPKKWNFFQRTKSPAPQSVEAIESETVPVVLRTLPQRSVAHYAFTAAPKKIDLEDLERIMREAEEGTPNVSRQPTPVPPVPAEEEVAEELETPHEPSDIHTEIPEPERASSFDAAYSMQREQMSEGPTPEEDDVMTPEMHVAARPDQSSSSQFERDFELKPRVPRLQQVGRIPKVVSTRPRHKDHERQLSDVSFSRPFAPSHPSPALRSSFGNALDMFTSKSPELRKEVTLSSVPTPIFTPPTVSLATSPGESVQSSRINSSDLEYIRLMGQRLAERGSDSSSCGSFPITAALTSLKIEPTLMTHEEDVWGEYDELIDALSPQEPKTPMTAVSTTSSAGAPFHYDTEFALALSRAPQVPLPQLPKDEEEPVPTEQEPPRLLSIAQKIRITSSVASNATPTVPQLATPISPISVTDFLTHRREASASLLDPVSGRLSLPSQPRSSTISARHSLPISIHARSSTQSVRPRQSRGSLPPPHRNSARRDSRQIELAENQHMGFESMANLRFGALMTSKWLSFGRVLFSPVHLELKDPAEDRILIIDGLGKDWSHYVALTYPKASVYNLGPEPVVPISNRASSLPMQSLPNHKHISHPSLNAPFPFPKGFFAAVIFRFPIATSEAAYRTALSESKRVLRPGGFLELSVLDIDMLNMGNRARRAVRQLKMEMQHEDASITLKPLSDMMQTMVGRRGFENLNRCFVAIPVAGCVPSSREDSVTEGSNPATQATDANVINKLSVITDGQADNKLPSFNDLLRTDSQEGQEGITKMVAQVARWWYMRCYESIILPNSDVSRSIWADCALRKECEKRGTSLRLMVCYAQKPECTVRRTASL